MQTIIRTHLSLGPNSPRYRSIPPSYHLFLQSPCTPYIDHFSRPDNEQTTTPNYICETDPEVRLGTLSNRVHSNTTYSEDHINNLEASLSVVQEAVELAAKESKVYKVSLHMLRALLSQTHCLSSVSEDEALARMDTLESEIYTTKETVSNQVTKSNGNSCAISSAWKLESALCKV